jgi:hypothetical protein
MARRTPKYKQQADADQQQKQQQQPQPHRVAADISQQAPHTSWGAIPLLYEDVRFTCIDCGREEIWTAEQQKWWYETAKGNIFSTAIRCSTCRDALRAAHGGTPRRSHQDRRDSDDRP